MAYVVAHVVVWLAIDQSDAGAALREHENFVFPLSPHERFASWCNWDGRWFIRIARHGYSDYSPGAPSSAAFFPLYPLLGGMVARLTGTPAHVSLLAVTHISFLALLFGVQAYAREVRTALDFPQDTDNRTVLLVTFWPVAIFYHVAYTEALFVLLEVSTLVMMRKNSNVWITAALVSLATATRVVGVAIALGFICFVVRRAARGEIARWQVPVVILLATSGAAAFMIYQWYFLGTPFAFMESQSAWKFRDTPPIGEYCLHLFNGDPMVDVYDPASGVYWLRTSVSGSAIGSLSAMNAVFFLFAVGVVGHACGTNILTLDEKVISVLLLVIPYVTHSYEFGMLGQARYAMSIIPVFVIVAMWLQKLTSASFACLCVALAAWMFVFASEFAMWGSAI